jgi:hypothetical protein
VPAKKENGRSRLVAATLVVFVSFSGLFGTLWGQRLQRQNAESARVAGLVMADVAIPGHALKVSVSSVDKGIDPEMIATALADDNVNTSWMAAEPCPQHIQYEREGALLRIRGYRFSVNCSGSVYYPSVWKLLGSDDGKVFRVLDSQSFSPEKPGDRPNYGGQTKFTFNAPATCRFVRFEITETVGGGSFPPTVGIFQLIVDKPQLAMAH